MRTVSVLLGGMIITLAAGVTLQHLLTPDFNLLIVRLFRTPLNSNDWPDVWRQWHHVNMVSVFICAPLAAIAAGVFVGLLQRRHVAFVAACTQVLNLLVQLSSQRVSLGAHSVSLASFFGQNSLPFFAAMIAAVLCHRLIAPGGIHNASGGWPTSRRSITQAGG
jgi:hypothetical protein